jgi:hypothetical protein
MVILPGQAPAQLGMRKLCCVPQQLHCCIDLYHFSPAPDVLTEHRANAGEAAERPVIKAAVVMGAVWIVTGAALMCAAMRG